MNTDQTRQGLSRLWDVPIDLTVEVARTKMALGETLGFHPGLLVPLNRLATQPVDVRVGGRVIAVGEVIVVDDEFGVRITDLVAPAAADGDAGPDPSALEAQAAAAALADLQILQGTPSATDTGDSEPEPGDPEPRWGEEAAPASHNPGETEQSSGDRPPDPEQAAAALAELADWQAAQQPDATLS